MIIISLLPAIGEIYSCFPTYSNRKRRFLEPQVLAKHPNHILMKVEEARGLLGPEYNALSDEQVEALVQLIKALCTYVITNQDDV